MFMMDLPDVLELASGDAFAFSRCGECGTAWRTRDRYGFTVEPLCDCSYAPVLTCETVGHILNAKTRDPQFLPLLMDIAENGKDTPALLNGDELWNGHHGVAALAVMGWTEIPVTYSGAEYIAAENESDWEEGSPELGYDG